MKILKLAALVAALIAGSTALAWPHVETPVEAARSTAQTVPGTTVKPEDPGAASYEKRCAICHGDEREGILPAFPPLLGIKHQMNDTKIIEIVRKGKGRMPGAPDMQDAEMTALLRYLGTAEISPTSLSAGAGGGAHASGITAAGAAIFRQNCAFCHGRDAMGGETGPDLTQSKLVLADVNGDQISQVIREGRIDKKMPAFNFSSEELLSLVAFIHERETAAASQKGKRRGVDISDLQTGNAQAGKLYFNGAGTCAKCHSPTGDLAGIASRLQGLQLEQRMLYPHDVKSKVKVTLPDGKTIDGTLAYRDEFTIGLKDGAGVYRSWQTSRVKFAIDSPVDAHAELFPKYTDDDIHNLMAYLQTLR